MQISGQLAVEPRGLGPDRGELRTNSGRSQSPIGIGMSIEGLHGDLFDGGAGGALTLPPY